MLSWYDRSQLINGCPTLYTEAGVKENVFFALLTALLTGADLTVLNRISDKTGVPVEVISKPRSDSIWDEVEAHLERNKDDPKIQALVGRSKELAKEIRQEIPSAPPRAESSISPTEWRITDDVVKAVIAVEGASSSHVGPAGDTGTMQILESTWNEINRNYFHGQYPYSKYAKNHQVNVMFGKKYLQHIKNWLDGHKHKWKGDPLFLLFAAYNGGMGTVEKSNFDPVRMKAHYPRAFDYATRARNLVG
jgi:soluble lytic murein transglycosylase-like protein